MVYLDLTTRERNRRNYRRIPINIRVCRWLQAVAKRTQFRRKPLVLLLRKNHAEELGLPDQWVTLGADGRLVHSTREEPIAVVES